MTPWIENDDVFRLKTDDLCAEAAIASLGDVIIPEAPDVTVQFLIEKKC